MPGDVYKRQALTKEKDELEVKNQELASANEAKKSDLQTQQTDLAELQSKSKDMELSLIHI